MTKVLRNATILAFTALTAAAVIPGCSGQSSDKSGELDPTIGKVGLAVQVAPGVVVNTVHYVVSGNGQSLAGDIPVANAGSTISVQVGLPAGTGYTIQMTAVSTDGNTHCLGDATFDVQAGVTKAVSVHLQCDGVHVLGAARVDGTLNVCPTVDTYTVAPLAVAVGGDIFVTATGSDLDGDTLVFDWTATAGTFAAAHPTGANATYHCSAPGTQTLTVKVSDPAATGATDPGCSDSATIQVDCVALACGNGTLDTGETCEPPNTATCSANCTLLCGNNTVDLGEDCEPPNTISCDATCHAIHGCGNGIVETGEACDTGLSNGTNGSNCAANCQLHCGNGVVDQGEQCDGTATPTGAPAGSACTNCQVINLCGNGVVDSAAGETCDPPRKAVCEAVTCTTSTCRTCELNNATASARVTACEQAAGTAAAGPAAGQPKKDLCIAVLDCARNNNCTNNGLNPEYCYCGNGVDISVCLSGTPAGVCKSQIEKGAESTVPTDVGARFVDPNYATGLAFRLIQADRQFCNGAANGCFN